MYVYMCIYIYTHIVSVRHWGLCMGLGFVGLRRKNTLKHYKPCKKTNEHLEPVDPNPQTLSPLNP